MKKLLFALMGTALVLGACSGNDTSQPEQVTDVTLPDTYDEEMATASYKKFCSSCHGGDLQGGAAYPEPINNLTKEEVYIAIMEGPGSMPEKMVTGEEAENLSVWTAAQ